ncbi:unnamed protein product [Orchesella dallaii]|uniref:Uncharacterized protein n=1 Tax=Orchesella dallaii TaxID=48710 RepID=A0ABP1RL58_9HEXA
MAKRYKLVPDTFVKRFLRSTDEEDYEEKLKQDRDNILKQNIPDDLKVLLHGDLSRNLNVKQILRREKPVLVKSIEKPNTPVGDRMIPMLTSQRASELYQYLKGQGISYNDKNEVVVHGIPTPGSSFPMILKGFQDSRVGVKSGMQQVIDALPKTSVPTNLFSNAIVRTYFPTSSAGKKGKKQKGSGISWVIL